MTEQVRAPSSDELQEIEALCERAARLQDEISSVVDPRPGQLKKLRDEIKSRMIKHGLRDVSIAGRPPIELVESASRKPTRKAIIDVMMESERKKLTEEQRRDPKLVKKAEDAGKMRALNLWNAIEPTTSYSVKIPEPTPSETEAPY